MKSNTNPKAYYVREDSDLEKFDPASNVRVAIKIVHADVPLVVGLRADDPVVSH
jgi:hypothetical protein